MDVYLVDFHDAIVTVRINCTSDIFLSIQNCDE